MLAQREFLLSCLPIPPEVLVHDWWFAINAAVRDKGVWYVQQPLVQYRRHDLNAIGAHSAQKEKIDAVRRFLLGKRRSYMRSRFSRYAVRVSCYISREVYRDENDLAFLKMVREYYLSYLSIRTRWRTIYLGYKLRKYLHPMDKRLKRLVRVLCKFF
jgi:hypothetical protein